MSHVLEVLEEGNRPETCAAVGLECGVCVRKAAGSVARICPGLDAHGAQQIFVQLFSSNGCQPMINAFERAYLDAISAPKPHLIAAVAAA